MKRSPLTFALMTPVAATWIAFALFGGIVASDENPALPSGNRVFAIVGDAGTRNSDTDRIRRAIRGDGIRDLIVPGDNLYYLNQTYDEVWLPWKTDGFQFPVVALGNHLRSYEEETRYFNMPGEFYTTRFPGFRYIVLNSDNTQNVDEQMSFLAHELEQAEVSDDKFVFLVLHHPPFTLSNRHGWKEKQDFQTKLRAQLKRHASRITAIFAGHDHIASLVSIDEIPLVISGAVFEQIRTAPRKYEEDGFKVKTEWLFQQGFYWARLDVDTSRDTVWLNFVRADNHEVSCSARIAPLPMLLRENCAKTTSRALRDSDVETPPEPNAPGAPLRIH